MIGKVWLSGSRGWVVGILLEGIIFTGEASKIGIVVPYCFEATAVVSFSKVYPFIAPFALNRGSIRMQFYFAD